jgi:hypothetical protein
VESESSNFGTAGVGVGKNVPTPTSINFRDYVNRKNPTF